MSNGAPDFPVGASANSCPPDNRTQDELLDLMRNLLDENYLDPIETLGPGFELLQAYAKMFERASLAVARLECGAFFTTAAGGSRSTGIVRFFRQNAGAGAVTVLAGTIVRASSTGQQYRVVDGTVMGGAALFVDVTVEAIADGWEWDVPGTTTSAAGEVLKGPVDTIELPLYEPPFGDNTIRVEQVLGANPITGGAAAMLDALGDNRGIDRNKGEADPDYAGRLRTLPDVISPDAIVRQLTRFWLPLDEPFDFIETFDINYQTCWDGPSTPFPGSDYDPTLWAYDDPRDPDPFRGRWLDEQDHRGAFVVVVNDLTAVEDVGMAYDDTALTVADHATKHGRRAHGAHDVDPAGLNIDVLQGGYDGFDPEKDAIFKRLIALVNEIKLGGVAAFIEKRGE
jgi:hypothetical protein